LQKKRSINVLYERFFMINISTEQICDRRIEDHEVKGLKPRPLGRKSP